MPGELGSMEGRETVTALLSGRADGIRAQNERLILTMLRRFGPMARAEIARRTGLSAQTMSVIMRALEEDGLILRGAPVRGKVGQPLIPMHLAGDGALFFGLKVGRRSCEMVLTNFLGDVIARRVQVHSHPTPERTIAFAVEAFAALRNGLSATARGRIAGLGIAIPFQLWSWAEPLGVDPAEMEPWRQTDLLSLLAQELAVPVFLQNDATAACGAELVFGAEDTPPDFLYFYVGYFIGGGLVLNDRLHTGPTGNAAALGSMPVPSPERQRQLIDVASLSGLERQLVQRGVAAQELWLNPELWYTDPPLLARWIEDAAAGIAFAITAAASVIEVPCVLIDGSFPPRLRSDLTAAVRTALDRMSFLGLDRPDLREGTVGASARALGAAALPLSEQFLMDLPPDLTPGSGTV